MALLGVVKAWVVALKVVAARVGVDLGTWMEAAVVVVVATEAAMGWEAAVRVVAMAAAARLEVAMPAARMEARGRHLR
jgi:hypothetical protein